MSGLMSTQIRSGQVRSRQTWFRADRFKSCQDHVRSEQDNERLGQLRSRSGQVRSGKVK